ncbi:MAG: hypothetical protein KDA25_04535, partial [Phycisphaerales bacterium]|nr:hypothetical protein [Phycisphaerales bacterium]
MAMYDAIVASEIGQMENIEDMQADPMAMMKAMNIIRNAWKKNNLEFIKTAGELVELNRRTHRQLASVLQRDSARALRRAFHRKAYRRVATGNDFADRQFERVLKHADDMSPDIVEAVRLAFDRFDDVEQRLSAEMCDELDAIRRSRREAPFDQMFQPVSQDKFNAVRERRDEVSRAAIEELSLLLGDERFAALVGEDDGAAAPMALGNVTLSSDAGGTVAVSVSAAEMPGTPRSSRDGGSDDYLPPPIRAATLDRYLRDLGATADQAAIAGMLHEDYLAAWDQVEQTDVAAMKAAQASIWSDEGGDRESRIEAADTLRRRALDAMLALDARLFNDLGATVLDAAQLPRLERIRLRRERIVYNRSDQSSNMFGGGTREGDLDLSVLVDEIVADASRTPADDLLAEYERDVHAHIIARYQQRLAFSKMNVMLTARMQREQGVNYWQEIQPGLRKVREAGDAIAALNRSYAPRITAALPAESARLFREQYKRRAFPGIYEERNIARQRFDDVSRLDLSVPQRRRLEAMEAEFEAKYDAACDKLVELAMVDSGFPMSENPEEWNDWQDRQVVRQRLNFEREELGQAAVLRLRTLLDEQQRSLVNMDVIDHRDSPWD